MTKVAVTGANGFVGHALLVRLASQYPEVLAFVREKPAKQQKYVSYFSMRELCTASEDENMFPESGIVIHAAARVHVMRDLVSDPLNAFRKVNVQGTLYLARKAAEAGVKRFVFISSIGVNGGETFGRPFSADEQAAPHSPYAVSKHEAEMGLRALSAKTGMEVVIVRPPLVYGPNAPGNFGFLMRWLDRGLPLPLGAVKQNRRSLVALDNLVDLLVRCIDHPAAANQTFLASDGEDISTTDLLSRMALALGRSARLIPVPPDLLRRVVSWAGKADVAQSLCGSLQLDISKTRDLLGWTPGISLDEGLCRAAQKRRS